MNFRVGAFYTKGTEYEEFFGRYLRSSLYRYKIPFTVKETNHLGSWTKNVAEKPKIILEMLDQLQEGENLVFLDADCSIEKYPELFDRIPKEYDIGFHYLDWDTWYGRSNHIKELLSGTLFIKNNDTTRQLLREWYAGAKSTNVWEQKVLETIIKQRNDLTIFNIPLEYCYIKTLPNGQEPRVKVDPVIVHHQVSRQMKKRMGR